MSQRLHSAYQCRCAVPVPFMYLGTDSGLCRSCTMIYDENLYERRLRQYVPKWEYDSVHHYLFDVVPAYRRLNHAM